MSAQSEDNMPHRRNAICPHCGGENAASATVCRHCMGPFMAMGNSDPMGSIFARGDAFTKAAATPRKPIVVIGIWMLFGPTALFFIVVLGISLTALFVGGELLAILGVLLSAGGAALFITILYRTTTNFFRQRGRRGSDDE